MKRVFKGLLYVLLAIVVLAAGLLAWLALRSPEMRPPSAEKVEATPERLARGRYLVNNVSDCLGCHSEHLTSYDIPIKPGTEGQGGFRFDEKDGFPGLVLSRNITPDPETGIGRWTDGEIMRAFREGIDRSGKTLFPLMPYTSYRNMSDEDARSIVAYLRTLPARKNAIPAKHINFPVNLMVKFAPKPAQGPPRTPDRSDSVAYGKYLVDVAGCAGCHTPVVHGKKDDEHPLSGGFEMRGIWGRVVSANLTPHPDTYVGRATRAEFIGRFKSFAGVNASNAPAAAPGRNTVMPWLVFSGMTEEDLGAIYDYLKTLPPVERNVDSFPDAPKTKSATAPG